MNRNVFSTGVETPASGRVRPLSGPLGSVGASFRPAAWAVALAILCVLVLGTRVYVDLERVRVRLVTAPRAANGPSLTVPLRNQDRLAGLPAAIIVHVHAASEPTDISVALDGALLAKATVPPDREIRIDTAVDVFPGAAREITVSSSRPGWSLMYLEVANVHGYAGSPLELVVAPGARRADGVPIRVLLPLLVALLIWPPRLDWPAGRMRYLHRGFAGLVLVLFAVALLAPFVTRYSVLLSVQTFLWGLAILYAEPLVRGWKAFRQRRAARALAPPAPEPRPPVPRWVTALDVLCLVVLGLMVRSMLGEGYRITFTPAVHLSLRSWVAIGGWLGVLLLVRHLAFRAVPWHRRVAWWFDAAVHWAPLRAVWPSYVISRVLVILIGYVAVFTIGFNPRQPWRALQNDVLDLFARWDAGWYFGIASNGYGDTFNPALQSDVAFFPGLPLLMRAVGVLLDVNLWVAGIIIVVVAFLVALTYVYRLAVQDLPADQARASVMFLAFYPFAFCYSAVLTESLFLLASAAAFLYFRRDELWKAAPFGLFAGLLRPNGFLLALPLGLMAVLPFAREKGWLPGAAAPGPVRWSRLATQLAVAGLPVLGMLLYASYLYTLTGNPFTFVEAQQAWGRKTAEILNVYEARKGLVDSQGLAAYTRAFPIEIIEAVAAFFALGAVWPIVRRFGLAYGVFVATAVLPPLISMGSISLGRYTAPLFPIFLWLGSSVPPERRPYWIAAFAALQGLFAALFFTWRPPY